MRAVLYTYSSLSGPQEKQIQSVGVGTNKSTHRVACLENKIYLLSYNKYNFRRVVFLGDRMNE